MSAPTDWLDRLTSQVINHIYAADVLAPVGCHTYFNQRDDKWEITLFASRTEVIAGRYDGRQTSSRFACDVLGVCRLFSQVDAVEWQTHRFASNDDLGAHLSVEGLFEGVAVWLRILAEAPDRFEAGRHALTDETRFENTW